MKKTYIKSKARYSLNRRKAEIYAKTNTEIKRRILTENNLLNAAGVCYSPVEKVTLLEWLKNSL